MAPSKKTTTKKPKASSSSSPSLSAEPPKPFKRAPEVMGPLLKTLSPKHVYIAHIDNKPAAFKRKIFLVPVAINVAIVALFALRVWYISPWYFALVQYALGYPNEAFSIPANPTWRVLWWTIARRGFTFLLDFVLFVFVWPWPLDFVLGRDHGSGSPAAWRWAVGFRGKEIYVRRSRPTWDGDLKKALKGGDQHARAMLMHIIGEATTPMLINEKTGYLHMNNEWDLDWAAMVKATKLVDVKAIALDAFRLMVVMHHEDYGWVSLDMKLADPADGAQDDARRTQVFAFRDALAAVGKEDLFYRWIEIVQYESTQPGGFGPEKQVSAAKQIRDLFAEQGIDFDDFWNETMGSPAGDNPAGDNPANST